MKEDILNQSPTVMFRGTPYEYEINTDLTAQKNKTFNIDQF